MDQIAPITILLDLARRLFNNELSVAEEKLFIASEKGEQADCVEGPGAKGLIRGDRLKWLCTDSKAVKQLTHRGISFCEAEIDGPVDLEWARISFPIRTCRCVFNDVLVLRNSQLKSLELVETRIESLQGSSLVSEQNVAFIESFTAEKGVDLVGARIGGNLACNGGQFSGDASTPAIAARGARIKGSVHLGRDSNSKNNFVAKGGVDLTNAIIGEDLNCEAGRFVSVGGTLALNANGAVCKGSVYLCDGFKADGTVDLVGSEIAGNLDCGGGEFVGVGEAWALDARGATIDGFVYMRDDFKAEGGVCLAAVSIGGSLNCDGGEFIGELEKAALDAESARIKGGVFLRNGFTAMPRNSESPSTLGPLEGEVVLKGARIGGNLECSRGLCVSRSKRPALNAHSVRVSGAVLLNKKFRAEGGVDFSASIIEGNIQCNTGTFDSASEAPALEFRGARIGGNLFLRRGFKSQGEVDLTAATIEGNLDCSEGQFSSGNKTPALNARGARIGRNVLLTKGMMADGELRFASAQVLHNFELRGIASPGKSILNLRFAKVGRLLNSEDSWPNQGSLFLGGLTYDEIDDETRSKATVQLRWIRQQPSTEFLSQPYEQLAAVLRRRGLQEDAQKVMIEKNKNYASHLHWRVAWLWYGLLGKIIGYGYRPWRAFWISLFAIGIGWFIFQVGYYYGIVTPNEDKGYVVEKKGDQQFLEPATAPISTFDPKFNAFAYSIETFVPLLKLGISDHWTPNAHKGQILDLGILCKFGFPRNTGSLLRYYLWFHTIAGWVLTTLWVGGLTGLVKT